MATLEATRGRTEAKWISLTVLTVLFGMQALRAFVPLTVFTLRDRFGWHAAAVGLVTLGVLAAGVFAAPARRALGLRRFLWITAGGLGGSRLALQLWTGDPLGELGLAAVASLLFFLVMPALALDARAQGGIGFVLGWLIGLAADTALHGAYLTWDVSWRSDLAGVLTVLVLAAMQWGLLAGATRETGGRAGSGEAVAMTWIWVAVGPLLFLELLALGNIARLATLTGWHLEMAVLWAVIGRILALAVVAVWMADGRFPRWLLTFWLLVALSVSFQVSWPDGVAAALWLIVGQVFTSVLWWRIVSSAVDRGGHTRGLSISHGVGLVTFGVLLFLYYAGIDIRLPFSKDVLPQVAVFGLGVSAIVAARSSSARSTPGVRFGFAWMATAVLLVSPLIRLASAPAARAGDTTGFPLRVMTYNLHMGLDLRGDLSLERLAATIEAESPDVVALQEVSRGWVVSGSVDVLAWLARRLDMAYVFAPTADPLWGNAVLSRRPILDHQTFTLPTQDLLIRRGFLAVRIDLGGGEQAEIIATHLHHPRDGGAVRELQSDTLLDFWQGRGRTVILGDFNASPGEPEVEMLRRAGLGDVLDLGGIRPGYTYPAIRPVKRIDYIWISPDLMPSDVVVPSGLASDHLPVVATLKASS